jgi:hypothetical protein
VSHLVHVVVVQHNSVGRQQLVQAASALLGYNSRLRRRYGTVCWLLRA